MSASSQRNYILSNKNVINNKNDDDDYEYKIQTAHAMQMSINIIYVTPTHPHNKVHPILHEYIAFNNKKVRALHCIRRSFIRSSPVLIAFLCSTLKTRDQDK